MQKRVKKYVRTAALSGVAGFIAGYKTSPTTTEHYLHKHLGHNTFTFDSKAVKRASWAAFRATGLSPTPWAVKHRIHHSPLDSQEPNTRSRALSAAVRAVLTNRVEAERAIADPETLRHITYRDGVADPLIDTTGESPSLKFQNTLDEWLSRHPVLERAAPIATIAILSAAGTACLKKPLSESVVGSTAFVAGFAAATYLPGLIAAYPERKDGYRSPTEAGIDLPDHYQRVFGNYALHASHHLGPHLSDPPGVVSYNRDLRTSQFLEVHGLGHAHDGQLVATNS